MPAYETPEDVARVGGPFDLTFQYDIDMTHGGQLTLKVPGGSVMADDENDHTVADSLIATIEASPDWTFVGGELQWGVTQEITP